MNATKQLIGAAILCSITACLLGINLAGAEDKPTPTDQEAAMVKMISGYTNWSKANGEPVLMATEVAQLCITPSHSFIKAHTQNPHDPKLITVFINNIGRQEFMTKKWPHFPEGTIIVKQKFSPGTNAAPELLTAMVKRKAGFDRANGNWEYIAFNGSGTKALSNGNLKSCQECHQSQQSEDYVFRSYLSGEVYSRLK